MSVVVTVADDLTGANATGSLLASRGFSTASCLNLKQWNKEEFFQFDAIAINAATRLLPEQEARERTREGVRMAFELNPKLIGKRIDSTLRGNLGGEIEAALELMDAHYKQATLAVVVPAFPSSGRLVVGGFMLVNGVPLEKTSIAKDPVTPLTSSTVTDIIKQQTQLRTSSIALSTVLKGSKEIEKAIEAAYAEKARILIIDATTDDEITSIAEALQKVTFPLLSVDPGPFTAALAASLAGPPAQAMADRVLAVVGSVTDLTLRQIETLEVSRVCHTVMVNSEALLQSEKCEEEIQRVVRLASQAPSNTKVICVCTARHASDVLDLSELGKGIGLKQHQVSDLLTKGLAKIALQLLNDKKLHLGGIYTSGGEVTVAVTAALQASGISVRDEVLPLAMYGRLIGGTQVDLPVITKGGFVGDANALVLCTDYMETKISTKKSN